MTRPSDDSRSPPPSHPEDPTGDLAGRILSGTVWNLAGTIGRYAVLMAATVVVAQLLTPAEYALGGMAVAAGGLFSVVAAQAFAEALVQYRQLSARTCHSVFWATLAAAGLLGGAALAVAGSIAEVYEQPALAPLIRLLALGMVVAVAGSVPTALLQRDLRFRELNVLNLVASLGAGLLAVAAAVFGLGAVALVVPPFVTLALRSAGAFVFAGYRPAAVFSWDELVAVGRFGLSRLGSNLVQYLSDNADYLILNSYWKPAVFGHYYFAYEHSRLPFNLVYTQLTAAVFPGFSRIQHDPERIRRGLVGGTRAFCLAVLPAHVLLIGLADPLIPWIFGTQWQPAVPIFQIFAAFSFIRALSTMIPATLLALGGAGVLLAFNVFRLVASLPLLLWLGDAGATPQTVALALLALFSVQAPVLIHLVLRRIQLPWGELLASVRGIYLGCVLMALTLGAIRLAAATFDWPLWLELPLGLLLPSVLFLLLARTLLRQSWQDLRRILGRRGGEKQPSIGDSRGP